jgi:hypothetical protein
MPFADKTFRNAFCRASFMLIVVRAVGSVTNIQKDFAKQTGHVG